MKNRFKKLLGLGILAAVVIATVPAVDVAAVGEANGQANAPATVSEANGSAKHEHEWSHRVIERVHSVLIYCEDRNCNYERRHPLELRMIGRNEEYSGKPCSGYQLKGKEELGSGIIERLYYKGIWGTEYRSSNPPTEVGTYIVENKIELPSKGIRIPFLRCGFRILPPKNSNPNDNTPVNNKNVSQNSDILEGNEPTKPAFDNKDCMDKVKDMAGAEIN